MADRMFGLILAILFSLPLVGIVIAAMLGIIFVNDACKIGWIGCG